MSGTKISALTTLTALADGTIIPVVDTGANYKITGLTVKKFLEVPVTNRFYVDPSRTDSYVSSGSELFPFKTVTTALTAIDTAITAGLNPQVTPVFVILQSSTTESFTLTKGRVNLVGESGSLHAPIYINGTVTVNTGSGTVSQNRISIAGVSITAVGAANALYFTGSNPTNLFLQDVWLQSTNTTNTTGGYVQDNTGTGSRANADVLKISQYGTGDVYCLNIIHGAANFNAVETSGATQIAAVQSGASLTLNNSELDANGDLIAETYGTGALTITNSVMSNTKANSNGIQINAAGSTVVLGNVIITVPVGTGKAVWYEPTATLYGSNLAYAGIVFTTGANTTIDPRLVPIPQVNAFGAGVGNVIGDVTGNIDRSGTATAFPSATTLSIGTNTAAATYNIAAGATISGSTKTVNIGTSGVAGSTTAITIGSSVGTSSVQVNGNLKINSTNAIQFSTSSYYSHQSLPASVNGNTGVTGTVSLDLWKLYVPSAGNRSLQFTLASGVVGAVFIGSVSTITSGVTGAATIAGTSSASWQYFHSTDNFGNGDVAVYIISDTTNVKTYRITVVYTSATTSSITLERIA